MLEVEGYDDSEVLRAMNDHTQRQKDLMVKAVRRFQHFNRDLFTKPKLFDRWRAFVHAKRLFKYWLRFVDKRSEPIKADMHYAFDKWKLYHANNKRDLTLRCKAELNEITLANNKVLDSLADDIEMKENIIDHLN
jgi:hypothetical protein